MSLLMEFQLSLNGSTGFDSNSLNGLDVYSEQIAWLTVAGLFQMRIMLKNLL
jgi:hypothetical protein